MPWWSVVLSRSAHLMSNVVCMPSPWWCVAQLIPFRVASSSARFICSVSFSGHSQQVSSMMDLLSSRMTPIASELASTQMVSSFPLIHQLPCMGLSGITLSIVSVIIYLGVTSCTSLSHPYVTEITWRFIAAAATLSHLHIGKWPTSFPHKEKVLRWVITGGTSWTSLPRLQSFSSSPLMCSPSTFVPSSNDFGTLHTKPKRSKCSLTLLEEATFSLT